MRLVLNNCNHSAYYKRMTEYQVRLTVFMGFMYLSVPRNTVSLA